METPSPTDVENPDPIAAANRRLYGLLAAGVALLAATVGLVIVLAATDDSISPWWVAGALVTLAMIGAVGVIGWWCLGTEVECAAQPPPSEWVRARCARRRRARIALLTTAATIAILAITQIALSLNDDVRELNRHDACITGTAPDETTPRDDATTSTPADSAPPAVIAPPDDDAVHVEEFGYERGVRTERFAVAVAGDGAPRPNDFVVFDDDGRTGQSFASIDGVEDYGDGEWRVVVRFDMSCYSDWEGGRFPVTVVYEGAASVAPTRWEAEVALQSRLAVYGLAVIPWIVVLAIYLVFDVWPKGLKRWVGSLIGMLGLTVGAYTANALRNPTWQPTVFAAAALVAVTWAAATSAAVVAKKGGYDLDDESSVRAQTPGVGDGADRESP